MRIHNEKKKKNHILNKNKTDTFEDSCIIKQHPNPINKLIKMNELIN